MLAHSHQEYNNLLTSAGPAHVLGWFLDQPRLVAASQGSSMTLGLTEAWANGKAIAVLFFLLLCCVFEGGWPFRS